MLPDAGFIPIPDLTPPERGRRRYRLDERSRCFEGHFDGAPILPAVAQLALVLEACAADGIVGVPAGLRDFRLQQPLVPGDEVDVACEPRTAPPAVRFELRCRGRLVSTGTLLLTSDGTSR